jgi:hypothetical protein
MYEYEQTLLCNQVKYYMAEHENRHNISCEQAFKCLVQLVIKSKINQVNVSENEDSDLNILIKNSTTGINYDRCEG